MFYVPSPADLEAYGVTVSGNDYSGWAEAFAYWAQVSASGSPLHSPYQAPLTFWFVVQVPKEGYSENIKVHETLPMWVAQSGKVIGVCKTWDEIDRLIEPRSSEFVYLTYRVKIPSLAALTDLLVVLHEKKLLEEEKG
ncbi:MAG: hypothetical protein L0Y56_06265 [Nitrospira sp.]|nr:hypothetical protein [Nitrospira sp.]